MEEETKICEIDPFGKVKCFRETVDFKTCLLYQLFWIRGILYRLVLDFESYTKVSIEDIIERILKREITDDERELIEKMYKEGKTITEMLKELRNSR